MQAQVEDFESAVKDLLVISESESNIFVEEWGETNAIQIAWVLEQLGLDASTPYSEIDPMVFLDKYATQKEYFDDYQKQEAMRFLSLKTLISEQLTDVKAFKIGSVRFTVIIAGYLSECNVLALRMKVVET
ncbi:MAG: hypothetical protein KA010_02790 [Saprospiraceae bacterium]|nr:hypothetical protein [Saprospiraceae bacterium]